MSVDRGDAQPTESTQITETFTVEGEEVHAPEGTFPADAKGFDGSPITEILEEREERLDPDNRPENTEVSNAGREFDIAKGMFKDEPGYEDAEEQFTAEDP